MRPRRKAAEKIMTYKEETDDIVPKPAGSSSRSSPNSFKSSLKAGSLNGTLALSKADIPNNWQPPSRKRFPVLLDVSNTKFLDASSKSAITTFDNKITIRKGDHIYMVLEPPSEPYYIARVLGFEKKSNLKLNADLDLVEHYRIKVNWYYRPRDISRFSSSSRMLYATMHTDLCPITSFRGVATVKHKDEIKDLSIYQTHPDQFWFEKLFDRYMLKFYDILQTKKLTKLPPNYLEALQKRFEYVFVEAGRRHDLLVTPKNCRKCNQWASTSDSVNCAHCNNWYHMLCLTPPLLKKPSRGYSWSCAKCSKIQQEEMMNYQKEISSIDNISRSSSSTTPEVQASISSIQSFSVSNVSGDNSSLESTEGTGYNSNPPEDIVTSEEIPSFERLAFQFLLKDKNLTKEERREKEDWPFRYLGMHARLEDVLDPEDRPYPRASSRLGTKHQASSIDEWHGHPEIYYDSSAATSSSESKRKAKSKRKSNVGRPPQLAVARIAEIPTNTKRLALPADYVNTPAKLLPPWIKPRPFGYIQRGDDEGTTSTLMWKQPLDVELTNEIDKFVFKKCRTIAKELKIFPTTPNFLDAIFKTLLDTKFDFDETFRIVKTFTRESLKEPTFSGEEVKRFEQGVKLYGSELLPVHKHVSSQTFGMIVRFYYLWKKTPNGHLIWDNFEGRKNKKIKKTNNKSDFVDSIADPDDDSSYDIVSSHKQRRKYCCKHCQILNSPKWFRAPGFPVAPSDSKLVVTALCIRCAKLWRYYAVQWEDPNEVMKNHKNKKSVEAELLIDSNKIRTAQEKAKALLKSLPLGKRKLVSPEKTSSTKRRKAEAKTGNEDTGMVAIKRFKNSKKTTITIKLNKMSPAKAAKMSKSLRGDVSPSENVLSKQRDSEMTTDSTQIEGGNAVKINHSEALPLNEEILSGLTIDLQEVAAARSAAAAKNSKVTKFSVNMPPQKKKSVEIKRFVFAHETAFNTVEKIEEPVKQEEVSQEVSTVETSTDNSVITNETISPGSTSLSSKNFDIRIMSLSVNDYKKATDGQIAHFESDHNYSYDFENYDRETDDFETIPNNETKEESLPSSPRARTPVSREMSISRVATESVFSPDSRACCVCRSNDPKDRYEILMCSSCGLNVHASCYGVKINSLDIPLFTKEWACDICSNDLHPLCNTYYGCSLCYSKEIDHDSAITGAATAYPDALKRTNTFKWTHVLCSIFSKYIKYEDPKRLQGATNISLALLKNDYDVCDICNMKSGLIKYCLLCNTKCHITCAQDTEGCILGFEFIPKDENCEKNLNTDSEDISWIRIVSTDTIGTIKPLFICSEHNQENTTLLTKEAAKTTVSESIDNVDSYSKDKTIEGNENYENDNNSKIRESSISFNRVLEKEEKKENKDEGDISMQDNDVKTKNNDSDSDPVETSKNDFTQDTHVNKDTIINKDLKDFMKNKFLSFREKGILVDGNASSEKPLIQLYYENYMSCKNNRRGPYARNRELAEFKSKYSQISENLPFKVKESIPATPSTPNMVVIEMKQNSDFEDIETYSLIRSKNWWSNERTVDNNLTKFEHLDGSKYGVKSLDDKVIQS